MTSHAPGAGFSESKLLLLIGAVQFVNVLDFMMVMPLGPDFARELAIESAHLGIVGGSYTASAAISGMVGALFLDRFDRRKALGCALLGLVLGTALGGFAWDLPSLIFARVVAGAFGGPATALAMAIVTDVVPLERRGRAMGAVMGAFSLASVFGVPLGLELARAGGWQTPFFAVAALGAVVTLLTMWLMPPLTGHLHERHTQVTSTATLLRKPLVLLSLCCTFVAMAGNFALIPNLSAYFQTNRHYPRDQLGTLYLIGGAVSFLTLRIAGKLADKFGPTRTAALGNGMFVGVLLLGFIYPVHWLPILGLFVSFMVTSSFRVVPMQALSTRVPEAHERARFMSVQSCVQHAASALGAMFGAQLLSTRPDGALQGIGEVASFTALFALLLPLIMLAVERRVRRKEQPLVVASVAV